jgi:hypothetical protein
MRSPPAPGCAENPHGRGYAMKHSDRSGGPAMSSRTITEDSLFPFLTGARRADQRLGGFGQILNLTLVDFPLILFPFLFFSSHLRSFNLIRFAFISFHSFTGI